MTEGINKFTEWPSWVNSDFDRQRFAAYHVKHSPEMIERFPESKEFYESRFAFCCQYLLTQDIQPKSYRQ